eukprot:172078-Chlamydomonas_euryale.AAC.4
MRASTADLRAEVCRHTGQLVAARHAQPLWRGRRVQPEPRGAEAGVLARRVARLLEREEDRGAEEEGRLADRLGRVDRTRVGHVGQQLHSGSGMRVGAGPRAMCVRCG